MSLKELLTAAHKVFNDFGKYQLTRAHLANIVLSVMDRLPTKIFTKVKSLIDADPDYIELSSKWSDCLSSRWVNDEELTHQWEAVQSAIAEIVDLDADLDFEIELAVADAECMEQLDYRSQIGKIIKRNGSDKKRRYLG